jgi:hypothetical protein
MDDYAGPGVPTFGPPTTEPAVTPSPLREAARNLRNAVVDNIAQDSEEAAALIPFIEAVESALAAQSSPSTIHDTWCATADGGLCNCLRAALATTPPLDVERLREAWGKAFAPDVTGELSARLAAEYARLSAKP